MVRYILLFLPIYWFILLWLWYVFQIHLDFGIVYDDEWDGYGPEPSGIIPNSIALLFFFFGTPIMFFIGAIYTALKKMWWWFAAYMGLAGYPIALFIIGAMIN